MQILRDAAVVQAFLESTPDPSPLQIELHGLISARLEELAEYTLDTDLGELVNFIVMEAGDRPAQLEPHLGFPILSNRFDGNLYGSAEFTPSWDALTDHQGWFELTYVMGDDGFGYVVFVPKEAAMDAALLAMLSAYARTTTEAMARQEATDP